MTGVCHRDPDVMHTDLGTELVLIHSLSGNSFRLNATGRAVWLNLPGGAEDLAKLVAARFEVDPAQAQRDIERLLDQLSVLGLVRRG